jgi:protein-S-isoprenylcysteine O-methyltransferase Ste14
MTVSVAKAIYVLCTIAWYVIRHPHARRSRRTPVRVAARTRREYVLIAIAAAGLGVIPYLYVGTRLFRFANYPFMPVLAWLGALTFGAALWLFYRTHRDLGRNWSLSLDVREGHTLVTGGVYSQIRHPMYAAFWLWAVAQALLLPNWVAGPAGLVGFGILYFLRVGEEERMMLETFGEAYRAYMQKTTRILPGIRL